MKVNEVLSGFEKKVFLPSVEIVISRETSSHFIALVTSPAVCRVTYLNYFIIHLLNFPYLLNANYYQRKCSHSLTRLLASGRSPRCDGEY